MHPETPPRRRSTKTREEETKKAMGPLICPPCYTLSMLGKGSHNNLHAEGCIGDKSCFVTFDTGASMTITRLDVTAGQPKRDPPMKCALQIVSGETLPILKEVFVKLTGVAPTNNLHVCHQCHR